MKAQDLAEYSCLGVRWTIGDASDAGFESLRLSIRSAQKLFGDGAQYTVCVNNVSIATAMTRTGGVPPGVTWLDISDQIPKWFASYVGQGMAEGVAWKLAPVRIFPNLYELSLDNDVILWAIPTAVQDWLGSGDRQACLMAADALSALGQFSDLCNHRALNSGIRGLPPGFDLETRLQKMLSQTGIILQSELDEQGLQAATLLQSKLFVVSTDDVSICSPFPMHQQHLGRCGVHFVGLNPKSTPWTLEGRPAHEVIRERWRSYANELQRLVMSGNYIDDDAAHWMGVSPTKRLG